MYKVFIDLDKFYHIIFFINILNFYSYNKKVKNINYVESFY